VVLFLYRLLSAPLRDYAPLFEWSTLLTYPAICWTAAFLLVRAKRKGSRALAITHLVAGFAWIAFVFYAASQLSRK
jgi:hypothetical protein